MAAPARSVIHRPLLGVWGRYLVGAAALGLLGFAIARLIQESTQYLDLVDMKSYVAGSQHFLSGDRLYPAWQTDGPYPIWSATNGRGYVYPPTAALLLAPLVWSSVQLLWLFASVAAYVGVGWLLVRRELPERPLWLSLVLIAYLVGHPGLHSVRSGQASPLIAAAFGAMWLTRQSGWLAVASGLVKATPGASLLWTIRRRDPFVGPMLFGAVVTLATLPFGLYQWIDWTKVIGNAYSECDQWWALPSFGCYGVQWIGWLVAGACLAGTMLVRRDEVAFALLSAALVLLPIELHWGYLLIPALGVLPVSLSTVRRLRGDDR